MKQLWRHANKGEENLIMVTSLMQADKVSKDEEVYQTLWTKMHNHKILVSLNLL